MKRILILLFAAFTIPCFGQNAFDYSNRSKRIKTVPAVPIVGCYSDTEEIRNEGLVVGNGFFVTKKVSGQYVAVFSKLASDSGESHPDVTVKNLIVNEAKKSVTFDLPLHSGAVLRQVKGQISIKGIKMNWGKEGGGEYGQASPFMKRRKCYL